MEDIKEGLIAVFDSGMGGISVLKRLKELMPQEDYLFLGDSRHAPYGIKSAQEVTALTLRWTDYFLARKAKAIVIACNTATSAAIEEVRKRAPELPVIGIEPAVKPAVLYDYKGGKKQILVLATEGTLKGEKYRRLVAQYQNEAEIISIAAGEIVKYVESGKIESPQLYAYLEQLLGPYKETADRIVLGCTHFPFVKKAIDEVMEHRAVFFDGAMGTARQTERLLKQKDWLKTTEKDGVIFFENSDPSGVHQKLSERLFQLKLED